jgi:RNA polymerase sigma-70 factor (ECF subfamily)
VLISAAQAGQEWAFVELCFRYSKRILFMLYKITKNREDAEDALQEAKLKAFVHIGDFNRASTFATWFTRIGVNSALMILRRKRARPEISVDAPVDESVKQFQWESADRRLNPEDHYIELEKHRRLQSAICKLTRDWRVEPSTFGGFGKGVKKRHYGRATKSRCACEATLRSSMLK